jgi:2-dehydro-3-deoxyphosphogluconate aldolase/(4S)-4-hydroxy-2-oxoglutarate aldolase
MPTGGVDERNAADYLRAGAVGVAVGGNLIDPAAVARGDWAAITERARILVEAAALPFSPTLRESPVI